MIGIVVFATACSSSRAPVVAARPRALAAVDESPPPPPPVRAVTGDVKPYLLATPEESVRVARAMARAIAVVRHDGRELVLLDGCSAPGAYGFMGQEPATARVTVRGADEIQANFPWRASALSKAPRVAKGVEPLAIDTLVLGSRVTTRPVVAAKDLAGACEGATHFIRAVTIGSHVTVPATDAWPPDACGYAKPESVEAPAQCAAIVAMHLVPVGEGDPFREGALLGLPRPACPEGLVRRDLACVLPSDGAFQCGDADAAACEQQCERGHAGSCTRHAMRLDGDRKSDRTEVIRLYERACAKNERAACTSLASMKRAGDGTAKDEAGAARLFASACDAGHARACASLATMYGSSWEGGGDPMKAFELDDRACRGGDPAACASLGAHYERGRVVSRWHAKALEAYLRACDGGSAAGCNAAGDILTSHDSELPHDDARALALFDAGCNRDDGDACAALGRLVLAGRRPSPGRAIADDAFALFTRACTLESAEGCADLGEMFVKKGFARRDPVRARATFEDACDRGEGRACDGAATLYAAGEGGAKDDAAARKLRERALRAHEKGCAASREQSCWALANAARFGLGVTKDPERASRMLSEQCRDDKHRACASLAEMLAKGEAGTRDVERAKALASKACERGLASACNKK
ncbi:MAG: sel1 repeat family protein [Labilithrix sp.]|nr:sel1 repeat family protein [Labilithrix sp.]